jgi:hypothetical protein
MVATSNPPMIEKAIGPQNTVGAIGGRGLGEEASASGGHADSTSGRAKANATRKGARAKVAGHAEGQTLCRLGRSWVIAHPPVSTQPNVANPCTAVFNVERSLSGRRLALKGSFAW